MAATIEKRQYLSPKLTVHGSVEKITEFLSKPYGSGDNFGSGLLGSDE